MVVAHNVYVGALWHSDCDPFCCVVAKEKITCEMKLQEHAEYEWGLMLDYADGEYPLDDIVTGGVSFEKKYELDDELQLEELNTTGYVVL